MPRPTPSAWLLAASLFLGTPVAHAIVAPQRVADDGSVRLQSSSAVRITGASDLDESAAWRSFNARHGRWSAIWNEATGSPHRATGEGIRLVGFADDAASVDRAIRVFLAAHPELFGPTPTLELAGAHLVRSTWYVRYRQLVDGLPLLFADWEFRVGRNGKLFAFGADAHQAPATLGTSATLPISVARVAARSGLGFDPATDLIESDDRLYVVPIEGTTGTEYLRAYRIDVTIADPPGAWTALVDAGSGAVLHRTNRVRHAIDGNISGSVHPLLPNDPLVIRAFPNLNVTVGPTTVTTDAAGNYSAPASGTVTVSAKLSGIYCNVFRQDGGPNATFSTTVGNPATVNLVWDNSTAQNSERDAYYHVNVAHDYVKSLDPTFTGLDYIMPTAVNIGATCNAFWNGVGVNFFVAGGGCVNTATIPDVVYHEYGHGVNDKVYQAFGAGSMTNAALHEGMADVFAALLLDDPVIGQGFFGPGTSIRTIDNTARWPGDASGDGHITGLIVGGAFWDLREAVGLAAAADLSFFALYGTPDDLNDGVAMSEVFIETLIADDDDANLANGTPHDAAIIDAFNAHGIGTNFFLNIFHGSLADPAAGGLVPVTANITYSGPIGQLDTGSPTLHYAFDGGAFQTRPMLPTGVANQYRAQLPAPVTSVVRYYISAADVFGGSVTHPAAAPDPAIHTLVAGPQVTVFANDMETDAGWTVGDAGDDATTGVWERADPNGTYTGPFAVAPEFAHSHPQCWVTENGPADEPVGLADVDGGKTTLFTNVFDATAPGIVLPMIEYYRWYTNNAGNNPNTDVWGVDLSNDGGSSWTPVENTTRTLADWARVVFRIEDVLAPTAAMKMRFIASDYAIGSERGGSIVEAAIDDFRLFGFANTVSVPGAPLARLDLAPAMPNPFRGATVLAFTLPSEGAANLAIYDLSGRRVRALAGGSLAAGPHRIAWDGRDDGGRALASGVYFVRLQHEGTELMRRVLRVK